MSVSITECRATIPVSLKNSALMSLTRRRVGRNVTHKKEDKIKINLNKIILLKRLLKLISIVQLYDYKKLHFCKHNTSEL